MTSPAFNPRELEVMGAMIRAWHPVTPLWIANGCLLSRDEVEITVKSLVAQGAVAHVRMNGIDEQGINYVYDAYILPKRVSPWMRT